MRVFSSSYITVKVLKNLKYILPRKISLQKKNAILTPSKVIFVLKVVIQNLTGDKEPTTFLVPTSPEDRAVRHMLLILTATVSN